MSTPTAPVPALSPDEEIGLLLADAECSQVDANRQAALRAERMLRVVQCARRHPELYVPGLEGSEAIDEAERAAILDLALRMNGTEDHVRGQVFVVEQALEHLPGLWGRARTGFASLYLVGRAVHALVRVSARADATDAEREAERDAFERIDDATSTWSESCSPAAFNRRLKALADRLCPVDATVAHARAMRDRRAYVEDVEDGMSWYHALMPTHEAHAALRRATSTAKHLSKDRREGRTRDQIRADLSSAWLRGVGTATAVKTKVFVTVPVQLLDAVRTGLPLEPSVVQALAAEQARVLGGDAIDAVTAAQMFVDAPAFRRVITDPVAGVVLDMDRRTYRPTRAQRDWLILRHGTCARDGCERLAVDADIDHRRPWAAGGATDVSNLAPLCPRDHRHRHRTRFRYRSRPDGSVQVSTPTGFTTEAPPPF
ncbi:HNH endonuclease signature motif containing protein [Microbacterium sp. CIAB417]|uniref:HNH endonuclease signature motif containing protein n=1 Tax=Microbacterium sp. CIAB417 TaxID=2860287 RepID=UPI001FAE53AB|nr:HNH endonuclease signature motif containing protein [Microbacterium sp. CIAB417]